MRTFMFDNVYNRTDQVEEQDKAVACVRALFSYYLDHPDEVPEEYHSAPGDLPARIADYISGMTDRYALRTYEQLFLPRSWLM
jgi:dGTPase